MYNINLRIAAKIRAFKITTFDNFSETQYTKKKTKDQKKKRDEVYIIIPNQESKKIVTC